MADGIAVTNKNYKSYRKLISLMPQESYLMNDSIENNILFGGKSSLDNTNIHELLNTVNAEKFVNKLIKKDQEMIVEDGSNISGGEKQRIVLQITL